MFGLPTPSHDEKRAQQGNCYCDECSVAYHQAAMQAREAIRSGRVVIEQVK